MKFKLKIGNKEYEIEVLEKEEGTIIKVNGKEFSFKKEIKLSQSFFPEKISKNEILAPISGIISEIFFKEGDFVKKGERILILSAMKMENEVCSNLDGKIKKIFVKKGEAVKKDQKLVLIE